MNSKIVEVIMTEEDGIRTYFTLEGVEIGSFKGGKKTEPVLHDVAVNSVKPEGGIVRSPTPKQVRLEKEKKLEEDMTIEKRLEHVKENALSEMS